MPTDKELIEASNLLGEYGQKLPPDWVIEFRMTSDESTVELIDPWGNEIDSAPHDAGASVIRAMVEYAREHDAAYIYKPNDDDSKNLTEAAKQVIDWYDRDGSVGGSSAAIDALRDATEGNQ